MDSGLSIRFFGASFTGRCSSRACYAESSPMKLILRPVCFASALLLAGLSGCGAPGIPRPPSLDLPQPVSDLRAVRKGDRVYLAWTVPSQTTDGTTLRHLGDTRICRSVDLEMTECANPVGKVAAPQPSAAMPVSPKTPVAKAHAECVDELSAAILSGNPAAQLFYSVSAMNQRGRSAGLSNLVSVPGFVSVPPPLDFEAKVTGEGVILTWAGIANPTEAPGVERAYRVYRREEGTTADAVAGEEVLGQGSAFRLVDRTFEWEKKYNYRATVVTRIHLTGKPAVEFEGDDSPAVQVFAHDIFPPAVPSGLQAAYSEAAQQFFIDLIWAPDVDADLAGYNIYRHEGNGQAAKVNAELVKAPAFRDTNVAPGHTYIYSVTGVDVRGNESAVSTEASETIP